MRVAVISDIHANLVALEAVLAAVDAEAPDALWCLGDLVGYGPRPNEVVQLVQERADVCLCGNHDLGVLGAIDLAFFSDDAAAAAYWTREVLSEQARSFLESLPAETAFAEAELYHASPRDPVWDYVLTFDVARESLEMTTAPVVLVGHSHVALALAATDGGVTGDVAPDGTALDLGGARWLLNPGSVGQPRDGDPRAAFLVLDTARRFAQFHRVEYSVERVQQEMRERRLPPALAARLARGE